jgi:hypothetical protein
MGGVPKAGILRALKPHIFFDDSKANLEPSCDEIPVAEVPGDTPDGGIQYEQPDNEKLHSVENVKLRPRGED